MVGKGCRSSLPKILVDQSWLGCFPMALPDQLATLAVLLTDKIHLEVPAESNRVQGIGPELHPRAFRSHPDITGHHRNTLRCAEHFLPGVSSSQRQATQILRRTKNSHGHNNDCARAKWENGDHMRATYGCLSAWRLSSSVHRECMHRARMYCRSGSSYCYREISRNWWVGPL
jgi:hypothetical protein